METWTILSPFAVRTTGFPIELLERLKFPCTTSKIREILRCEADIAGLQRLLLEESFPVVVRQAREEQQSSLLSSLSSSRRSVGHRRCVENLEVLPLASFYGEHRELLARWNILLAEHTALLADGQATWQRELAERRRELRRIVADPCVQEAIFLSNPDMFAALQRYLSSDGDSTRTSAIRKLERRLVFYLQRFCAKNETQSFFGPINYGQFDLDASCKLQMRQAQAAIRQRVAFPGQWLAETLAAAVSADPGIQPYLRPRRGTFCRLEADERLVFPAAGISLVLDERSVRLFQLADGQRTLQELAALLDEDWTATWERGRRLQKPGALTLEIILPGDSSQPLAVLREWLTGLPEDLSARATWIGVLDEIERLVHAFASSDFPARVEVLAELEAYVTGICGKSTRRGAGKMYSDRLLLFEECLGNLAQCTLGGDLARAIEEKMQPLLRLSQVNGQLMLQRQQRAARALWQRLLPESGTGVPFLAYLQALQQQKSPASVTGPDELDAFLHELRELVRSHSGGHCSRLRGDELPGLSLLPEADACNYSSLDIMIAAASQEALQEGDFQLVLGEVHPYPLVWVFPTAFFLGDNGQAFAEALRAKLQGQPGGEAAAQIAYTRKSKIYPYPLPGATLELRSRYPDCRAIPAASVEIREWQGQLRLSAEDRMLRLYTPLKQSSEGLDPIAPFAFPAVQPPFIELGEHTPRIEIDDLVYQRERWVLPGGQLCAPEAKDFARLLGIWRWKARQNLPDEVFVRAPQEPKPFYLDLSSYFLVEILDQIARQSSHLIITEMLPNTRQLWLTEQDGRRSCEFRVVVVGEQARRPVTESAHP